MTAIKKVVSTVWYDKKYYHELRNVFPEAEFVYVDFFDKQKLEKEAADADVAILLGDVDNCLLSSKTLKWIACDHAGLNGSARPEVFESGIKVTGAAGRSAPVLAEHCIYFMLNACYHTKELLRAQENCQWGVEGSASWKGLYGRTCAVLGMGNNGRMLADRLQAFGMKLYLYDKFPIKGYDWAEKKCIQNEGGSVDDILPECDFVVLTLPLTDDTYHMFNAERFAKMKKGTVLVNMARGGLVKTDDLIEALNNGTISCAGLDVVEEQPLPAESPLWKMENVYITPHCTPQVPNRAGRSIEIIRENARRFRADEPMKNLLRPSDASTKDTQGGGWAKLLNATTEQIKAVPKAMLEKYLGKMDWTDPSEWNYVDKI